MRQLEVREVSGMKKEMMALLLSGGLISCVLLPLSPECVKRRSLLDGSVKKPQNEERPDFRFLSMQPRLRGQTPKMGQCHLGGGTAVHPHTHTPHMQTSPTPPENTRRDVSHGAASRPSLTCSIRPRTGPVGATGGCLSGTTAHLHND